MLPGAVGGRLCPNGKLRKEKERSKEDFSATPQAQLSTTRSPIRTVPGAATTAYTPAHGYWPRSPTCSLLCRTSVRRTKPPPSHGLGSCLQCCIWKLGDGLCGDQRHSPGSGHGQDGCNLARAREVRFDYAMVSRMRVVSSPQTIDCADNIMRTTN